QCASQATTSADAAVSGPRHNAPSGEPSAPEGQTDGIKVGDTVAGSAVEIGGVLTATTVGMGGVTARTTVAAGGAVVDKMVPHHSTVVVGEVLDTQHPHLPGRVLVRWLDRQGQVVDRWLQRERHLSLRKADRVLVTLPAGWNEWVVTGALGREASSPLPDLENVSQLRLQPGEVLRVVSYEGHPLVTLRQGPDGPVLELGNGNVELAAARTLRLSADSIEIASAAGGIDLRSDGDTVVRARTIRLN
ncbi:hypothetical protein ACFL5O_10250, partial [Myxococcota bacterium]